MTHAFVHKQARVKTHTGRLVLVPCGSPWALRRECSNHAKAALTLLASAPV